MRIGICLLYHSVTLPPADLAVAAEARGLDAFFVPENSHVPLARPGTIRQFEGIERLARFHDPFITLAAAAARTTTITLGTGVCLMTQREPVATAIAAASLDHLSQGRLCLGVAGGFIRESMEDYGSPFGKRWQIVRERVEAMKSLWQQPEPAYTGQFVSLPEQQPPVPSFASHGPPVYIGSNSKSVPARVARYADGWITLLGRFPGNPLMALAEACDEADRDVSGVNVILADAPHDAFAIDRAISDGYNELHYFLNGENDAAVMAELEHIAALAAAIKGQAPATG